MIINDDEARGIDAMHRGHGRIAILVFGKGGKEWSFFFLRSFLRVLVGKASTVV